MKQQLDAYGTFSSCIAPLSCHQRVPKWRTLRQNGDSEEAHALATPPKLIGGKNA